MSKILPWDNVIVNIAQTFPKRIVMKISSIYTIFNFPVLTLVKAHFFQCSQIRKPLVTIGTTCWLPDYRKSSLLRRGFLTMHILHPRGKTPKKGLLEYDDPVLKNGIFEGYILRPRTWRYGPNKWKFRRVPVLKCLLTYDIDDDIWQDDGKILRLWHSPKRSSIWKLRRFSGQIYLLRMMSKNFRWGLNWKPPATKASAHWLGKHSKFSLLLLSFLTMHSLSPMGRIPRESCWSTKALSR